MPNLPEVISALRSVIETSEHLRGLVKTSCDIRFDDLTTKQPLAGQIGDVVREMYARGKLIPLLDQALEEYGGNANFRCIAERNLHQLHLRPFPPVAPTAVPSPDLIIRRSAEGLFEWLAPFPPEDAARLWDPKPPVDRVIAELEWDEDCPLNRILLRLLCHCPPRGVKMEVQGNTLWMNALRQCLDEHLPTECPQLAASGWNEAVAGGPAGVGGVLVILPAETMAETVRGNLDAWCLRELGKKVLNALQPGSGYTGRFKEIDAALAKEMRTRWKAWEGDMAANSMVRTRFLDMLVSWHDDGTRPLAGVGLGPESVSRCMLPATLLALAVACCLEPDPLRPAAGAPGNVATSVVRGHASGVELVASVPLEYVLEDIQALPWSSQLVLLANCKDSPDMLRRRNESLFAASESLAEPQAASWGRNAPLPPAMVTFDRALDRALKAGKAALTAHLDTLVKELANHQRARLDLRAPSPAIIETAAAGPPAPPDA